MLSAAAAAPAASDGSIFFSASKRSPSGASPPTTTSVRVTVRRVPAKVAKPGPAPASAPAAGARASGLAPDEPRPTAKKRRSTSPAPDAPGPSKVPKTRPATAPARRKSEGSSARSSRASSRPKDPAALLPEPIYRHDISRSRSTSAVQTQDGPIPRQVSIPETGGPCPDALSCEGVIKRLMKSYETYFHNPNDQSDKSFEIHETNYPYCVLEYPNTGASERFILLAPKDKDHYNPIMCLEKTVQTIVKSYLTRQQQALFGYVPNDLFLSDDSPPASPEPLLIPQMVSSARSSASPPPRSSHSSKPSSSSSLTSLSSSSSLSSLSSLSSSPSPAPPLLRNLRRAINTRNGPWFQRTMTSINTLLLQLKHPPLQADLFAPTPANELRAAVARWDGAGLPKDVLARIVDEAYQRAVGPNVPALRRYEAFSSEVYGELMPAFVSEVVRASALGPGKLFVDLGSGVGNVVLQAALQSGCDGFGVEINAAPARVAREHLVQFRERCRMWGVGAGEVELEEGNMLESPKVDRLLAKADVVLVNNKVFLEPLNEALRPKFLDLKEGALLISLKPFVSPNARLTERNLDDMSAIFDVTEHAYHSGHVSWGSSGGTYYIHRVDRTGYAAVRERFERNHGSRRSASARKYTPSNLAD